MPEKLSHFFAFLILCLAKLVLVVLVQIASLFELSYQVYIDSFEVFRLFLEYLDLGSRKSILGFALSRLYEFLGHRVQVNLIRFVRRVLCKHFFIDLVPHQVIDIFYFKLVSDLGQL